MSLDQRQIIILYSYQSINRSKARTYDQMINPKIFLTESENDQELRRSNERKEREKNQRLLKKANRSCGVPG